MTPIMGKKDVQRHFDEIAPRYDYWKRKNAYYYTTIKNFISRIIPPGKRVLEVGCGTGEILAAMQPSRGVGIDISAQMVQLASAKFPQHAFINSPKLKSSPYNRSEVTPRTSNSSSSDSSGLFLAGYAGLSAL